MRRELAALGATLGVVQHGSLVTLAFQLPQDEVPRCTARLENATQGRIGWLQVL